MIPLVDLKAQYAQIEKEIKETILSVLARTDFILGDEVEKFEKEFASYCGVKYAVGLDSGISALELGMRAMGIGAGMDVLTPVNSFIASSSSISFTGATPIFVDCDTKTYEIDVNDAAKRITKKTRAIMPVHLYGQVADMDKVEQFARKHSLIVIEDACQAHGAVYKKKKAGSFGDFAAFSFYPGKNLGAYGDAGMLVTQNKKIYETVKTMRNYGQTKKYHHVMLAWNRRLDTIQAAVLRVKLKYLDAWNQLRHQHARLYTQLLKDIKKGVTPPYESPDSTHIYHQYVIRTKGRSRLQDYLSSHEIGASIHYPVPIHLQPAYRYLKYKKGDFPVAEKLSKEVLSLPMFPELKDNDIMRIVKEIQEFFGTH